MQSENMTGLSFKTKKVENLEAKDVALDVIRCPVTGSRTLPWELRGPVTGSGTLHWPLRGPVTGSGMVL